MECCKRPIGVFDSGMGGLSVWQEIVKLLPSESIVYYGDGKNCPYGERSREEVIGFVQDAIDLFIEKKCKAVVLACNAATAMSVEYFRKRYPEMIIVGMEPAVKPAALNSRSGNIGILATKATLEGALFRETSHKFSKNVNIISSVGEGFVELVEGGLENTEDAYNIVHKCVKSMLEADIDHIVLGCTHYPFLAETLKKVIGDRNITIVNPAPAIALRVKSLLEQQMMLEMGDSTPEYSFYSAREDDYSERLKSKAMSLIGR